MAKKKRKKEEQTFNVYPYLGGYQHFMRNGGALPKFKEEGSVDASVVANRIKPHNKYGYANTYKGVVDEWKANNDPNYVPRGSFMGQVANTIQATGDFGKTVMGAFNKDNYKPGGKYSKIQTKYVPGNCSDPQYTNEEDCTKNGKQWNEAKDEYDGLKYANQSVTNTTGDTRILHADNFERYNNMSKKEKKEFMDNGGRNTDLWKTPEQLAHGEFNYMDIDPVTGLPRYDGINLKASTLRADALEEQTGDRMFSNKTRVKQADGSYKFVYFDDQGGLLPDQSKTEYDKIEEGKGPGGLADANATHMNIQYESEEDLLNIPGVVMGPDGYPIHGETGERVVPKNQTTSFDHYVEDEQGNMVYNKDVDYDPTKEYGDYSDHKKFKSDRQKVNECEQGFTCPGSAKGTWIPSAEGGSCDCSGARYGTEVLNEFIYGGALPKFQLKGGLEFDENGDVVKSKVLDLENETNKEKKKRIKNYTHPHLQEYYDEFARKGDWKEKDVRDIMSSMNIQESDTAFVNQSSNMNALRSKNNMDVNQYIGSQMYDDGSGNWSGNISYDDKQKYFTTEQDEDGMSWDFMKNLYNSPRGNYTGVLKSRKEYGGALDAFVYGGALPKYQEAGPTTEGQTVCPPPEGGCPEGQTWDKQACSCMSAEVNMADMSQDPYGVDAFNQSPMSNFDVNANAEDPMMVADESENSPASQPRVMSLEESQQAMYDDVGLDNPHLAREGKGEFTCSDGVSKTREECEANEGTWNDPNDMGIDTNYGKGPVQKAWNKSREFLNTGVMGALGDTLIGSSAEKYCSDPQYKTKEECEKEGAKWIDQKGTGAVSLLYDNIIPMAENIMGQNAERKDFLHKRSVSSGDLFAATESGRGSGQKGFHDVNKGGLGDDLYGTGKIFGQIAQQGMEMPEQDQRDLSGVPSYMDLEDNLSFDLEFLKEQKNYLGKMNMGGHLPKFQDKGENKSNWNLSGYFKGEQGFIPDFKGESTKKTVSENESVNKALDYTQTGLTVAGMQDYSGPIAAGADLFNSAVSGARAYAAPEGSEQRKVHTENAVLNATSAIPGYGLASASASLAKDTAGYAGVMDTTKSVGTQVTDSTKTSNFAENLNTGPKKVGTTARDGGEQHAEIDMDLYYELMQAGADIKIIR